MADVRTPPRVLATSDCERCRPGLVTQPANTVSSLAYVAAGAGVLVEARRRPATAHPGAAAVGWSLVAVGAGSVAYHGPGGGVGRWLHDASLLAMTGLVALSDVHAARGTAPSPGQVAAVGAPAGVAAHPRVSGAAQAATAAGGAGGRDPPEPARRHRRTVRPVRTGGAARSRPRCSPRGWRCTSPGGPVARCAGPIRCCRRTPAGTCCRPPRCGCAPARRGRT